MSSNLIEQQSNEDTTTNFGSLVIKADSKKNLNNFVDFQTVTSSSPIDSFGKFSNQKSSNFEVIFTHSSHRTQPNELFLSHSTSIPSLISKFYNTENYIFLKNLSASDNNSSIFDDVNMARDIELNSNISNDLNDSMSSLDICSCGNNNQDLCKCHIPHDEFKVKQFSLKKQIYSLQEELIRTKLLLDQSQNIRKKDLEANQRLKLKIEYFESQLNDREFRNNDKQNELVKQISKLSASERSLVQSLENEKNKVIQLNDELVNLKQILHESEMLNDSLENHTFHIKIEINPSVQNKNLLEFQSNIFYLEVLDELKSYGFNSSSNYQDIIVFLYKKQANALREINQLQFHLKLMQFSHDNPLDTLKNLLADLNFYKSEINYLTKNIEILKSEKSLQREANTHVLNYFSLAQSESSPLLKPNVDSCNKMPIYTSTAEFVKTKLVTIPSCESNCIYAVETEGIVEEKCFYQKHEHLEEDQKNEVNKDKKEEKSEKENNEKAEEFGNTLKKAIDILNEKLEQITNEKKLIDTQLQTVQAELTTSLKENSLIISKHEQQVQFLNEQIQAYQVENSKTRNENNELRITQAKNNHELTQLVQNYDEEITKHKKQFAKVKEEHDCIKEQYEKLLFQYNQDLTETTKRYAEESASKSIKHEKEINQLHNELAKARSECENYRNESEKFLSDFQEAKLRFAKSKEELKHKMENYELEIINLNKELTKIRVEFQNTQLDYSLKCDETNRLQKVLEELIELKEKFHATEQKLNQTENRNLLMQEKLSQLQNDLINKDQDHLIATHLNNLNLNNNETLIASQENLIENLKHTIQEQFAIRNASAQHDIEELKFKIHELSMKLAQEKILNESLDVRCKLIDQDNQSLRRTLLNHTRKFNNNEKVNKNRMEEINEIIEQAQKSAQLMAASQNNKNLIF